MRADHRRGARVRATTVDPVTLLKQGDARTGSQRAHRFRDAFVVAQLTLAVVVLGVAAAAAASLREAIARDPYAVVSQSVLERAQEIRIRMTFGAEPRRLFTAEMMRAGRLVSVSAIGGVAAACAAPRVLSGAFSGFGGSQIAPLAASTGVLAALAAAATAVPAWRACRRSAMGRT